MAVRTIESASGIGWFSGHGVTEWPSTACVVCRSRASQFAGDRRRCATEWQELDRVAVEKHVRYVDQLGRAAHLYGPRTQPGARLSLAFQLGERLEPTLLAGSRQLIGALADLESHSAVGSSVVRNPAVPDASGGHSPRACSDACEGARGPNDPNPSAVSRDVARASEPRWCDLAGCPGFVSRQPDRSRTRPRPRSGSSASSPTAQSSPRRPGAST
jgi:hypothetical protein